MEKEQLSKEEKEKAESAKALREDRNKNLESLIGYAGANHLKNEVPYGKEGVDAGSFAFNSFLASNDAQKIRNDIYNRKVQKGQEMQAQMGYQTISSPEYYVTNHELEMNALGMIQDAQENLTLKDIGEVVKKIAPGLKGKLDKIPGEIGGISYASIMEKSKKAKDEGKKYAPTMEEKGFLEIYAPLTEAYKKFSGLSILNHSTTETYNAHFDSVLEGYKTMKEEAAKKAPQ